MKKLTTPNVPRINLLPWRELKRLRQNEQFRQALMIVFILSLLILAGIYGYFWQQNRHQQAINDDIKQRMARLDEDIVKIATLENQQQAILQKAQSIQSLSTNRQAMVRLWEHLAMTSGGLVYLTAIHHAGDDIRLMGVAKSTANVSRFAQSLQGASDAPMLGDVMVTRLQDEPTLSGWTAFTINAKLNLLGKLSDGQAQTANTEPNQTPSQTEQSP